jgi:hypothetical protein
MGIDVKLESEQGEQEDAVLDPQGFLPMLLSRCRDRHWLLIHYIDSYGDTVFNHLQIPTLLDELSRLKEYAESDDERAFLKAVLSIVERTKNQAHSYVRFYGD